VPLVLATGLAEGSGLFLMLSTLVLPGGSHLPVIGVVIAACAFRTWAWWRYRKELAEGAPTLTLEALRKADPVVLLVGLVAPVVAATVAQLAEGGLVAAAAVVAGLLAAATGWLMKFAIITRASYNQGFALVRSPSRGPGGGSPGVKPGWS